MPLYSQPVVNSALWSGSVFQPGTVLQDIEVLKQRVYIVVNTPLGSDPLRPLFGTDIYSWVDKPLILAAANIKREIIDALTIWVPEVNLKSVKYTLLTAKAGQAISGILFTVNMSYGGGDLPPMTFSLSRGTFAFAGVAGMVIADARIPYNRSAGNYQLSLTVNGMVATPAPDSGGYATMAAALAFAESNWDGYGDWGMGKDVMVCYCKAGTLNAKLKISIL